MLVLIGMLGFVASFAFSLGPGMWVLFSEIFPNRIRGARDLLRGTGQLHGVLHRAAGCFRGRWRLLVARRPS